MSLWEALSDEVIFLLSEITSSFLLAMTNNYISPSNPSDNELTQYRWPVSEGPSLKTCPR